MDMVERVAAALATKDGGVPWEDQHETWRKNYRATARLAIEAMREPTEAMREAAAMQVDYEWSPRVNPHEIWPAMIDAALRPEPVPERERL